MADEFDRRLVRDTAEALEALNKKLVECYTRSITVALTAHPNQNVRPGYIAEFTRTETIYPAQ